ncbi:MAG: helix-turn-helix transcriptional regulator [Prolixibacteraceae bacterium]|jgi:DNA-binding CsgD family transcriptional regulator
MSNSPNKSIVLISPSDIVLKGLAEILKSSLAGEIIQLHRGDEIIDYPELSGHFLVIANSEELEKSKLLIRHILPAEGSVQFLTLNLDPIPQATSPSLNIYDSHTLICYKVNEILNSFVVSQNKEADTELTRREIEVLQLLTKGYSNKEIADQLFVSTHTVISHRKNISEKTGIKSASGLTMYAILKKIIDVSEIDTADLI